MKKRKRRRYPKARLLKVHDKPNNNFNHKRKGLPPKQKHRRMTGLKTRPKKEK